MKPTGFPSPSARRRGFTALEVTAVAAIIALLAVILIPIMRTRVEDSKKVAAQEDLAAIEKAETLAYADTNHYVRLQDLTCPVADQTIIASTTGTSFQEQMARVPHATWNRELRPGFTPSQMTAYAASGYGGTELMTMATNWKGAQLAVHHGASIKTLIAQAPWLFSDGAVASSTSSSPKGDGTGAPGGPILVLGANAADDIAILKTANIGAPVDSTGDPIITYPVDPWGNPYLFFGSGKLQDAQTDGTTLRGLAISDSDAAAFTKTSGEKVDYGTAAVYSLGPDGVPGKAAGAALANSLSYYREMGFLGATGSDDLSREF
jgi:prepilin-type N-terminal cleavage/methylation domain-containing protein